mgnify:CR=1 FL=1
MQVDFIRVSADEIPINLKYISYDAYIQGRYTSDERNTDSQYGKPIFVYRTQDHLSFGVSPIPDEDIFTVEYEYFKTHTDLSAHGENMSLPDRFGTLIVDRAKYYTYMLRSDPQHAQLADRDFQRKLRLLKVDYATKNDYMRSDTIAESIATNRGARAN